LEIAGFYPTSLRKPLRLGPLMRTYRNTITRRARKSELARELKIIDVLGSGHVDLLKDYR
jgi:hypothetical protein